MQKNISILLIEDVEADAKILKHAFNKGKLKVNMTRVGSAEEAIEYLLLKGKSSEQDNINPDIIILDIKMPGMDGLDFVKNIKTYPQLKPIPIIVFSTIRGREHEFAKEGVNDYILKSLDAKDLITRLKAKFNIS